jgi:hypothetical protein
VGGVAVELDRISGDGTYCCLRRQHPARLAVEEQEMDIDICEVSRKSIKNDSSFETFLQRGIHAAISSKEMAIRCTLSHRG